MEHLEQEIATYERRRDSLEAAHRLKWVVVHGETIVGTYPTFEEAAEEAVRQFGRGPYLIRQVAAPPIRLPSSVVYEPLRAVR